MAPNPQLVTSGINLLNVLLYLDMTEFEKPTPVDLVFDLDGTLTDPLVGFSRCLNYALSKHGFAEHHQDDLKQYIGPPFDVIFEELMPADVTYNVDELVKTYRERYSEVGFSENVVYEGIPEALVALKSLGLTMGVCTSKRTIYAERILDLFNIRQHFQFVDGGEVGVPKDEQLKQLIIQGRVDERSIMIGDRKFDIYAARKNNMRSAGVLYGYGDWDEIVDARPDWCVELPEYLADTFSDINR